MSDLNPNCDGSHCRSATAPVRVYPLGGGANLILCEACAAHENRYRAERGRDTGAPENWPQQKWGDLKPYPESVTRYVPTYINKDGMRTLMRASQGRFTFATFQEAAEWMAAVTANNSPDNVRETWGDNPRFEVRPCPCWPGHFDPQTVWFD